MPAFPTGCSSSWHSLLCGLHRATAQEAFAKANQAYAAGDFAAAQKLYVEALGKSQDENAWFNLGNAYYRTNDLGRAALAYERSLLLCPAQPAAAENLRFLRQKNGARVLERSWLEKSLAFVPPAVSPWLGLSVAWIGFAWAGAALWRRSGTLGLILGSLLVILGATYSAGLTWWKKRQATEAIVTVVSAEAKSEPSETARSAEGLLASSRVRVLSTLNGWHFCQLPSGSRGWLPAKNIELLIPPNHDHNPPILPMEPARHHRARNAGHRGGLARYAHHPAW